MVKQDVINIIFKYTCSSIRILAYTKYIPKSSHLCQEKSHFGHLAGLHAY